MSADGALVPSLLALEKGLDIDWLDGLSSALTGAATGGRERDDTELDLARGRHARSSGGEVRQDPPARAVVNSHPEPTSNQEIHRAEAREDRVLIDRARQGDTGAFRHLVERYQRRIYVVAYGLLRDEQDAREVVQEAFLRIYRGLDAFEGGGSFFTWMYRIVTNLAIDSLRRASRRESESLDDLGVDETAHAPLVSRIEGADPSDAVRRGEIAARLRAALQALPPYHRGVILLREVEGMSYDEMAEAMGVSKGTIMSRLYHARRKLQAALADCYADQIGGEVSALQAAGVESGRRRAVPRRSARSR